ncbi:MAG: hypothetical protein FJX47_11030 [Alphaproteobacteria bacterium]|nr:hypothetical protein [Alphaproteobacteria bacterium]
MANKPEYTVHLVESPAGQAALAAHGLTTSDLARAVVEFQRRESVRVGTLIGVNQDGFFGSTREGWRLDQPDAFAEPLLNIPWVQILELLNRLPDGTTGEFLESDGKQH